MNNSYICKVTIKNGQIASQNRETLYFIKEMKKCNKTKWQKTHKKNAKFCNMQPKCNYLYVNIRLKDG